MCQHEESIASWKTHLGEFNKDLLNIGTSQMLILAITSELTAWHQKKSAPLLECYSSSLQQAIQHQREIGWKGFLEGLVVKSITQYQKRYAETLSSNAYPPSITKWASKLHNAIWTLTFSLWEACDKKLHDTNTVEKLRGRKCLEQAARRK